MSSKQGGFEATLSFQPFLSLLSFNILLTFLTTFLYTEFPLFPFGEKDIEVSTLLEPVHLPFQLRSNSSLTIFSQICRNHVSISSNVR